MSGPDTPPLLRDKDHGAPSAFTPESLLREAQRQTGAERVAVPQICLLIQMAISSARSVRRAARGGMRDGSVITRTLGCSILRGQEIGVVGYAVGASFSVLVAEEIFASCCRLLISVTSSGQTTTQGTPPYFIVIDRAWRDEGTIEGDFE